jgi:hypothetical protein
MVLDARLFVRKQAIGLELTPRESQRLGRIPEEVQHAIRACKPESSRSSRPNNPQKKLRLLHTNLPTHTWGFKAVMEAITRHAGCGPTTLYVWTQDLTQGTLQRQSIWRPKGTARAGTD